MAITGWRGISGLRGIIGLASLRMRAMLCWRRLRTWSGRGLGPPNFKSGLVWVAREAALDQHADGLRPRVAVGLCPLVELGGFLF
jgi:hypothetical protein